MARLAVTDDIAVGEEELSESFVLAWRARHRFLTTCVSV